MGFSPTLIIFLNVSQHMIPGTSDAGVDGHCRPPQVSQSPLSGALTWQSLISVQSRLHFGVPPAALHIPKKKDLS